MATAHATDMSEHFLYHAIQHSSSLTSCPLPLTPLCWSTIPASAGKGSTDVYSNLVDAAIKLLDEIQRLEASGKSPLVVAIDGGSGAGKSTLALLLANQVNGSLIQIDDFFAAAIPDDRWDVFSIEERLEHVFDWQRLRESAIEPLLNGRPARWHAVDFESGLRPDGTYGMRSDYTEREPSKVILLDGVYSAGPQLADLVDLAVLVDVSLDERHARLAVREEKQFLARWHKRWDPVENYYLTHVRPRSSFNLVVWAE